MSCVAQELLSNIQSSSSSIATFPELLRKQRISEETNLKVGVTCLVVGTARSVWFDYHCSEVKYQLHMIQTVTALGILLTAAVFGEEWGCSSFKKEGLLKLYRHGMS